MITINGAKLAEKIYQEFNIHKNVLLLAVLTYETLKNQ